MAQQQQQELQPHQQQQQQTRDHNRAGGIVGHSEKRKHRALECESDEDDFAGFDEDATASGSENGVLNSPHSINSLPGGFGASLKKARESQLGDGTFPEAGGGESPLGAGKQDDMESLLAAGGGGVAAGVGMYATDAASKMALLAAKQRKPIAPVNPNDEAFKVPFKYGWKRELVYRAHMDGNSKDKGEVYYITPAGKKLRTRNDIVMALHDGLTMDNFTFIKDPVGGSPDEEIIRSAKTYGSTPRRSISSSTAAAAVVVAPEPPAEIGKRVPKPKMPKGASPPPFGRASLGQQRTPPSSRSNSQTSPKSGATAQVASRTPLGMGGSVVGLKPNENSFGGGGAVKSAKLKNKVQTCSIQCLPAMGMIPQLQCISCTCMYHPECVEATTAEILARRFTCKICLEEESAMASEFDGKSSTSLANSILPLAPQSLNNGNMSSSSAMPGDKQKKPTPPQQPPRTGPGTTKTAGKEPPMQDVIVVGNHQFIVVPKGKPAPAKPNKKQVKPSQQPQPPPQPQPQTTVPPTPAALPEQPLPNDEHRKSNASKSLNNIGQSNNRSSSNFIAADLAAIRTNDVARSSSLAAGLDQNRLFASNFFSNVSIGYDVLQQTFQYLKVQELLRASCVCRMWNQVANHPRLWRTVRMKNSHVNDWAGLAGTLRKNGTKHLDLRKMLISGNSDEMWASFAENIAHVDRLERIDLCRCSSTVVGSLLRSNPYLKVLNALAIKNDPVDFSNFEHGRSLQELRLKSSAPVSVDGDLSQLGFLTSLRHLSLTSILKLGSTSIAALGELEHLESLELGECTEIGQNLADILPNLTRLQRLRLEKGQEAFNMFTVLEGIAKVPSLSQLELINCDVKVGFDKHLHRCANVKKLLLIPTYVSQSAATNHMVLSGVAKLKDTLETFIWTVTVELLRVTELYIDQCDTKNRDDKNSPGESIPILKPVPGVEEIPPANSANPSDTPAQVEIVPLVTVTSILDRSIPNTKVKILKIPFASTWKQGMIDLP
uniref:Putative scf ubiquitin ligase skp2 component n=1 Tax=Culex tarsalis TaxID=7177 RepID=A0A1Q3EZM6_CULTA